MGQKKEEDLTYQSLPNAMAGQRHVISDKLLYGCMGQSGLINIWYIFFYTW